jgi:predicted transcriptional regulator
MPDAKQLSRRQREIMDVVFGLRTATVNQVVAALSDPPTPMAVRRMMHVLVDRGFLKKRRDGREVVYSPARSQSTAGVKALQHVLDTFFGGAMDEALAAHLSRKEPVGAERLERLEKLIAEARKKEN